MYDPYNPHMMTFNELIFEVKRLRKALKEIKAKQMGLVHEMIDVINGHKPGEIPRVP